MNPAVTKARRWLANKYRQAHLEASVLRRKFAGTNTRTGALDPANVVWIFGSGRSGSTWLRSMMGEMKNHRVWEEPLVGRLFGSFYNSASKEHRHSASFILGEPTRKGWIQSIRTFVLDGAMYAQPRLGPEDYLIVKEPNGSAGAPLLMEALPESHMILLVRDPRDVVASVLDGARAGNWLNEWSGRSDAPASENPNAFVRKRANTYLRNLDGARQAYKAHRGPRALVRYEDLLADTLGTMKRMYAYLDIPVDEEDLAQAVEKHSWERIPQEEKGEGKFYRKGAAGGWREDLTPEQAEIVEKITAPILKEFYPV